MARLPTTLPSDNSGGVVILAGWAPGVGAVPLQAAAPGAADGLGVASSILAPQPNINAGTLINAVAATTTQTGADQTNNSGRGVVVYLNTTAIGTGSITLEIDGKDPASGTYYAILTGVAVVANAFTVYRVYPGLTAAANAIASDVLPMVWRVKVTANNANAATYTVGANVIE